MNQPLTSQIAKHVIAKCGGVTVVKRITGRTPASIYKWCWPKEAGGTGGLIPVEVQQMLMAAAQRGEVSLTPADFFPIPDGASRADR